MTWRKLLTVTISLGLVMLAAATAPTAARAELEIMASGDEAYPPYEFNNEQGLPTGFNVEIMTAVAKVMGLRASIHLAPWDKARQQLERGQIDALCGMYYSAARAEKVLFSSPHLVVSYALFVRDGSAIDSLADIDGKTLIVQRGDIADDYAKSGNLNGKIIHVDSPAAALRALAAGKGDCALLSRLQGLYLARRFGLDNVLAVGPPVLPRRYCFAVKKSDATLLSELNEGLSIIHKTGQYDKIYQKWFGPLEGPGFWGSIGEHIFYIATPLLLVLLLAVAWTWSLRRKVAQRTSSLRQELAARQSAEQALQQSEQHLRALIDGSIDGIIGMDPKRRITSCNPAFLRMFGYEAAEVLGQSSRMLHLSRENFERLGQVAYNIIQSSGHWRSEIILRRKSGQEIPISLALSAFSGPDGEITGYVAIMRDISQRRRDEQEKARLENQLRHAQKMEAVGTLAGGIAHDFNNILGAIMGYAELALIDAQEGKASPDKLCSILASAKRARDLVRRILTFSRKVETRMRPLRLDDIIDQCLEAARPGFARGIKINRHQADNPPLVSGDASQLEEVIKGLLSNASDAMEGGGELTIETRKEEIGPEAAAELALKPGLHALARVRDTGCGMDARTLAHVFDPFFTTKEVGKGTGLGLATAFGVIKAHGGSITCQSAPGRGSVFEIRLPAAVAG